MIAIILLVVAILAAIGISLYFLFSFLDKTAHKILAIKNNPLCLLND